MKKSHHFPTGSKYDGSMNEMLHCMEGFGVYVYPDGSEYRGYFRNGKFHGYGELKLASPYKVTFKGVFESGSLADIETIIFSDDLHFQGNFDENGKVKLNQWSYCNVADRRYWTETEKGMRPVGPNSFLTHVRPSRDVPPRLYDIEEGMYRSDTGFVLGRAPPFKPYRFVGCDKEVEFIHKHCRKGPDSDGPEKLAEPNAEMCYQILNMNLEAAKNLDEILPTCSCKEEMERKRYWPHLRKPVGDLHTDNTSDMPRTPDSLSYSSFSDVSLVETVEDNFKVELQPPVSTTQR